MYKRKYKQISDEDAALSKQIAAGDADAKIPLRLLDRYPITLPLLTGLQELAAQLAECCCELKEKIECRGEQTRRSHSKHRTC